MTAMSKVIVWSSANGSVAVCYPTGELPLDEVLKKDCPSNAVVINETDLPQNQGVFFEAWELSGGTVSVNLDKAKAIGHDIRRAKRAEEFAPYDKIISLQVPGADTAAAEQARNDIRFKYALIQETIDLSTSPDEIKAALGIS
jgi:hypothetical protein